jgi:hypothetical protein
MTVMNVTSVGEIWMTKGHARLVKSMKKGTIDRALREKAG